MSNQVKEVHMLESGFESFDDGGLKRGLKNRHVQMIALGGIIGSAFFLGTGSIVKDVGPSAFLSYALGGLIVYLVMIALGELAVAIPISGSFVNYASEFISPSWAAGVGWSYYLTWVTYIPAECIAGGIIMKSFIPGTSEWFWAVIFGIIITVVNLSNVEAFGEIEFWLAIIKVAAIIVFCMTAVLIIAGVISGGPAAGAAGAAGSIGLKNLLGNGGLFPNGGMVLLTTMVMLLVNFQGVEIIGLTAGEAKDPSKTIPIAVRSVTYRIILLFMVPVFLLVVIFPWSEAAVENGSVFAAALNHYGLNWAAGLFSFVVLTAAVSCANSGVYSTVRVTWAMAREGMAPKVLGKLNKRQVPGNAALFVIAGVWFFLVGSYFFAASEVFIALLSISGFTGGLAWISIIWSQINFRKRLVAHGYSAKDLKYAAPGFPYLSHLGLWMIIACMVFTAFNEKLRIGFYAGVPLLILPIIIHKLRKVDHEKFAQEHQNVRFSDIFKPRTELPESCLAPAQLASPAEAPVAPPADEKVTGDVYAGPYNKYLFRGNDLSRNKWVVQGGVDLTYKNFTLSYWTNFQTKDSDGQSKVTEDDITINYAWAPFDLLNVNFGNNLYTFLGSTTNELYIKTTLNTLLAPTLAAYWDWDEATKAGLFYTLSISHPIEVSKELSVTLGALASYNQRNPSAAVDPNSNDSFDGAYNSLHNYEFSISADYTLNDKVKISPSYLFSNAFNDKGRDVGIEEEHVYGIRAMFLF